MSKMADFDFVLELSNEALLRLIKANWAIAGTPANPPFEIMLPVSQTGVSANAHLIVDELKLDLNADDTLILTLEFSNASLIATQPLPLTLSQLDGTITVKAPILLVNGETTTQKVLATNLSNATVALNLSTAANTIISNALRGSPITPQLLAGLLQQEVQNYVHGLGIQSFPQSFNVVPGVDGSFTQFEKLEVHCIPNPDRKKQVLALFAILLTANHAKGNHNLKQTTAIHPGREVCVSISPDAFQKLIFCPAVAKELLPNETDITKAVSKLPGACGSTGGLPVSDATLTSISSSFNQGYIDFSGTINKSGICYDANGSFHGKVSLTFQPGFYNLQSKVTIDDPDVDVSIPWYCWLAAWAIFAEIGLIVTGILNGVASSIADNIAKDALGAVFGNKGISGIDVNTIPGTDFDKVATTPEGLTLSGWVKVKLPEAQTRSVAFQGSVVTAESQVLSTGTFKSRRKCPEGDYPYKEYAQKQIASYRVVPTLLGLSLQYEWKMSAGRILGLDLYEQGDEVAIPENASGTITIPKVNTLYPFPLPGGNYVTQNVHLAYEISGDTIKLTNTPKEGNYFIWLHVKATDPMGHTAETTVQGHFEGDTVKLEGGYEKDLAECLDLINQKVRISSFKAHKPLLRHWVLPDHPPPEELVHLVNTLIDSGVPEANEILPYIRLLFGHSFYQALGSSAVKESRIRENISGEH